ncbi:MAG: hypothetical protein K1X82_11520 [Bacteroidia bacterium]|nr:hypothetical protein [Bacteroidia bacterium]
MKLPLKLIFVFSVAFIFSSAFYYRLFLTSYSPTNFVRPSLSFLTEDSSYHDIVIIGNSRSWNHFNPQIIDSITSQNSIVIGLDGSDIPFFLMGVRKYIQSHPIPKTIVVPIDFTSINTQTIPYNFLEYYDFLNDTTIANTLGNYFTRFRFKSSYYYYLTQLLLVKDDEKKLNFSQLFSTPSLENSILPEKATYKGFFSPTDTLDPNHLQEIKPFIEEYAPECQSTLQEIINCCQQNQIQLIFVQAPFFHKTQSIVLNYREIENQISETAFKNQCHFLDFDTMAIAQRTDCFFNFMHLNSKGANLFSTTFARELVKIQKSGKPK